MATPNDFSEYYKTLSNAELLSILENSGDYQPAAIEAAKKEFSGRQISDKEISEAKQSLIASRLQKEKQTEKIRVIEDKVKKNVYTIFDSINPVQREAPTAEKIIRSVVIVFSLLFLFLVTQNFKVIPIYIKDISRSPFESVSILLPFVIIPVATILFWKRKAGGWILLIFFVIYSVIDILLSFILEFRLKSSGIPALDRFFPKPSLETYIFPFLFWVAVLYTLCKASIREAFKIDKQIMIITIVTSAIITIFFLLVVYQV
ncbi:MAG: hypothetical protein Q8941_24980 [Bacteroidota bacterium]|nr:hypothetical protein [Bacteroidota bacterium]